MILNIHGFQSWGANAKAAFLGEAFPEVKIVSPTLPLPPGEALSVLEPAPAAGFYNPFNSEEEHTRLMEKKIKWGEWAIRHVATKEPEVRLSPPEAADLRFPKP